MAEPIDLWNPSTCGRSRPVRPIDLAPGYRLNQKEKDQ